MKSLLFLSTLSIVAYCQAGLVPASTTLIRQSTAIAHSPAVVYSQHYSPVAFSYSAPSAYSHSVVPTVYSRQYLAPALHYTSSPFYSHGPVLAQQSIYAQYPGFVGQTPFQVAQQYPVAQGPVFGQLPVQGGNVQGPVQGPGIQGGSPVIEAADNPQFPQNPPPQNVPQSPEQQSPILGGASPGTTVDDDTVSVDAA